MSRCNKVKNPCKICLGTVSHKNGLQCQGACQSWVHYTCLNYTPGKIKDIKAGIIKVTCPCPDCKTSVPKEYRTDQPFSCNNAQCPANRPPKCDNEACPINEGKRQPARPSCPLNKCGNECKQFTNTGMGGGSPPNCVLPQPCIPPLPPLPPPPPRGGQNCPPGISPISSSDACLSNDLNKCPSGCSTTRNAGDIGIYHVGGSMPSFHVVEQMCNTVGQLTNQINDLMVKMKEVYTHGNRSPRETCHQPGPRSMCPKPCYCPGNPVRRK